MSIDPVLTHARALWEELARVPVSFDSVGGLAVVASPESWLCPHGWVGAVRLGSSAIVTAPSQAVATVVSKAISGLRVDAAVDVEALRVLLPVADVLGPATLGYLGKSDFQPASAGVVIDELVAGHPDLHRLAASAGNNDADEAGLTEITSPTFVIRDKGDVVAASGYRVWPRQIAHLSVLTAPGFRGLGLGRAVASSAVTHALGAGLVPQWRARPVESRRVAAALGFRELGAQLSFRLA